MGLNVFALIHPLGKAIVAPPAWMLNREFDDGLGNMLRLVLHRTPTTGVAVSAGSPVGFTDAFSDGSVTTDFSQTAGGKLAGMSMIAITLAESFAALTWAWVMTKGRPSDYIAGGRGVPLGDSDFNPNVNPITELKTNGSVADGDLLVFTIDDTWNGVTEPIDGQTGGGIALKADAANVLAAVDAMINVGQGMGFTT